MRSSASKTAMIRETLVIGASAAWKQCLNSATSAAFTAANPPVVATMVALLPVVATTAVAVRQRAAAVVAVDTVKLTQL